MQIYALFTLDNVSNRKLEIYKKRFCKFFMNISLSITIKKEHNSVNFFDIKLHIETVKYKPYHKVNTSLKYININSNHLRSITCKLVENISKRISILLMNEEILKQNIDYYKITQSRARYK